MRRLIKEVVSDSIRFPNTEQMAEDDEREVQQAMDEMSYHLEAYRRTRIEEEKKQSSQGCVRMGVNCYCPTRTGYAPVTKTPG